MERPLPQLLQSSFEFGRIPGVARHGLHQALLHQDADGTAHGPDDVEAEVKRLEALGARRWDHQQERGFDFWIMRDPWENEFCILPSDDPNVIAQREPPGDEPATGQ